MPVRIYDIAKRVGVESKVVLAKARELGITTARVASSTLDKITAEYLEEQMGYKPAPPEPPAQPPEPASPPPTPPGEPPPPSPTEAEPRTLVGLAPNVTIISAEPQPAAPPQAPPHASVAIETPIEVQVPAPPAEEELATPPSAPLPPELPVSDAPITIAESDAPVSTDVQSAPPTAETPPAPTLSEVAEIPRPDAEKAPEGSTPAVEALPPSPPPPPPGPKLGDKIGFIQLPNRPRFADRSGGKGTQRSTATRPDAARSRDPRGGQPAAPRPSGAPGQRAGTPAAPPAREPGRWATLPPLPVATGPEISLKPPIIVRDLAEKMGKKPFQLIADLMELGVFATVNQAIESEHAQRVCAKYNFRFRVEKRDKGVSRIHRPLPKKEPEDTEDRLEDLKPRPPVVTIMGHVDHGKTSLLDVIRRSNVVAGEAGEITQHIGAYSISVPHPERPKELCPITFLDTPGHAAFSAMRARGAHVTDIVVLVVAANDGVMPQTLEALSHAQAAKVAIVVAVNKCDHPNAEPMRVRQQLQERGLTPDDWGGDTIFVDVSAITKQGIDKLLGSILLQAELLELKANPSRPAKGNVVESGLEPGGPTATLLVRKGTLQVGQLLLCGQYYGKVRALIDEGGKRLKAAEPSRAVKMLGLNGVPEAGAEFVVVESEKVARALCEERAAAHRDQEVEHRPKVTLETIFQTMEEEQAKILRLIVKADTQGSIEAIVDSLRQIDSDKVSLDVIYSGVGAVTKEDVLLASASKGIILGFHTRIDGSVADLAKREGVQIKLYAIIYELIDQVKEAMVGLLDPLQREVVFGVAEVRQVFTLSKGGHVAGCVVLSGRLVKGKARVMRRRNLIHEGFIQTLRRYQDDANEVRAGMECGIRFDGFDGFLEGDTIECYTIEVVRQQL